MADGYDSHETNCTVRVYQGSVFFKISSSDPKDIINIQANGKWVADYNTEAVLRDEDDKNYIDLDRSLNSRNTYHKLLQPFARCFKSERESRVPPKETRNDDG
ncbi:hypothetical protein MAR_017529 [Mya arenaria]|uniref:Uncharacterized protein n=1 Tax=Mya arenaria TaxID=6604 RepID=A0ABY7EK48_MYAAR|nr:hypothetical protein MAR_017529 [Mya arenaria]